MEIHGGDQARSFQEILKLPRPFLSQAEQMELGMSSLCPTPAFRLSLLATCNDANPLVCCPLDTTTTAGSILHLRLGRTQQKHPKQTASNHPTGMETQRHRRRRRTSRNGLVLGALCFIATLPFLYLQKDKYEQRRLLAATSYSQHVDHPILKGFHRRRRNRGMKEDNSSGRKGNDDAHRSLHNITQSQAPPQDEHDCLVVFHLPKTGGSSLLYALRFFALERGWEFYDYHGEQREVWQEPTKPVHRAIHYGHFYSTFLERSGTSQCLRMTLLRDPIDRVVSHFYYWEGKESHWPRVTEIAKDCEGNPHLQRNSNQFSNLMTRMLMGGSKDSQYQLYSPHLWHIFQPESSQCQYAYPLQERAATQSAINHLKNMDLVCFMDDLEGCMHSVRRLLRLPSNKVFRVPHKNSANANAAASGGKINVRPHDMAMKNDTIREWVASVNQADIALYEWALDNAKKMKIL